MQLRHVWILLILAPLASAEEPSIENPYAPTPTTMYMHLNGFQDAPINTQRPDDRYYAASDVGMTQHSQGCVESPGGTLLADVHHTQYGYSSPGYVQYDIDQGGEPRYHSERGISFDVELDATAGATFHWYLESQWVSSDPQPNVNTVPSAAPQVVVQTTIREGDAISVGHEALNVGRVIAQGQTEPAALAGPLTLDHPQVTYIPFGDKHLYEFKLDMPIEHAIIKAEESYNVRVDVYMDLGACSDPSADEYLMADLVRTHTSADYRPRLDWTVMNPLRVDYVHPQFLGDDLVIHMGVNSPWGNYDVLGDEYDNGLGPVMNVDGPGVALGMELAVFGVDHYVHDHHTEAVAVTYVWPYQSENAIEGLYAALAEFSNDQETAKAFATGVFDIGSGETWGCGYEALAGCGISPETEVKDDAVDKQSPGAGFLLVPALGLLALRRKA